MRAGADRLDPQVSPHLALVLAVIGEGRIGDPEVEDAAALVADQAQPRVTHDLAVCNIARCSGIGPAFSRFPRKAKGTEEGERIHAASSILTAFITRLSARYASALG